MNNKRIMIIKKILELFLDITSIYRIYTHTHTRIRNKASCWQKLKWMNCM